MECPDVGGYFHHKDEDCGFEVPEVLKQRSQEKDDLLLDPCEKGNPKTQLSPNAKSFSISSLLSNGEKFVKTSTL